MMNLQFVAPIFFLVILKFRRGRFLYTPSYFYYFKLLIIIILFFEENIFVRLKIFNSIRKDKKKNKKDKKTTMNDNLAPKTESRQIMAKKLT